MTKIVETEQQALRRKSVRLGRRFAGSIAVRLDAHPPQGDGTRIEEERRILEMAREVLAHADPDPCVVSFLTQAVELHTKTHGFSKAIYDELFKLHQRRLKKEKEPAAEAPLKKLDARRYLVKV